MKILIVDDSSEIRALMRVILENLGHTVAGEAEEGAGALKAFAELRPDLVFLDIIMPGRSGLEVLWDIRKLDPHARVIMVTAVDQDDINSRLSQFGAAGIIYKPFTQGDFERALQVQPGKKEAGGDGTILGLAAGGLSRCMLRTSDATSWAWEMQDIKVFPGRPGEALKLLDFGRNAAAVQVNLRDGAAFTAALVVRSEDIRFISSCFASGPLYPTDGVRDLEERLVMEIGNIILNALTGPLVNALKESVLPSVPVLVKGGPAAILAALGACFAPDAEVTLISASLAMRRDGRLARAGVTALLPAELAGKLK